jgi:hypothetical protein
MFSSVIVFKPSTNFFVGDPTKKTRSKRQVFTEEKSDEIAAPLEHSPSDALYRRPGFQA